VAAGVTCLAVVAILALGVRLYMSRAIEDRLRPAERVAIAELRPPLPHNAFLACPSGRCAAAGIASPVFEMPWQRLRDYWKRMIAAEPRVVPVEAEADGRRIVLIQHSKMLRFPDIVTVEFIPLGEQRSSVAIYSRARYGRGDFGINRQRVRRWLAQLQHTVSEAPAVQ